LNINPEFALRGVPLGRIVPRNLGAGFGTVAGWWTAARLPP